MNQQLTETFRDVADHLDVPPIDHLAFQRKVRAARGRRALLTGSVAAAAACVVAVAAYAVPGLVPQKKADGGGVATPPAAERSAAAFPLVMDGRLSILRSNGAVVGMAEKPLEAVGPWGTEGVLAIGADGRLSAYRLVDGEYHRVEAPTGVKVREARTSNDGGVVGWIENKGNLTLMSAGKSQWSVAVSAEASLFDVQGSLALYWDAGKLQLRNGDADTLIPTKGMPDWALIAGDVLQVAYEDKSVFYRLAGGEPIAEHQGVELISPDGGLTFGLDGIARTLAGQARGQVTGLPGPIEGAVWLDNDTLLVSTGPESGATKASVCETATLICSTLEFGYRTVELPTSP